ncbi:MBL fold metallo-hydrolase [Pseudomonas guariconensis]|uniref:MBL fold metallo-hydrolase n=1 Tax=Pseudomonas guariconensis TaxID=1288410 RepID=UPI0018D936E6|nr:MBL fold metallo-hydrolase [Pseudomonas guariconensis]MBH3358629.1 MBL fold metallo-hydrolase [Pseudomonas guariconensis]
MHIHHLNCGCMCPWGGALFDGYSPGLTATVPCHCLLVETERDGLVLVDTGFGYNDIQHPQRLSRFFRLFNNIRLDHRLTALDQIRRLGFDPRDVSHIVLTHLDFDHAGGLEDFPQARVHVMGEEISHATQAGGWIGSRRYRARQWQAVADWEFYPELGEQWFGFDAVRALIDVQDDILLVPLGGHTHGHAGIALRTGQGWLLHAGDAYFHHLEVHSPQRRCPPGMRLYQRMMDTDHKLRLANQRRLRDLVLTQGPGLEVFCSHDRWEMQYALTNQQEKDARCQRA